MNEEINRINQILPTSDFDDFSDERTGVIQEWIT